MPHLTTVTNNTHQTTLCKCSQNGGESGERGRREKERGAEERERDGEEGEWEEEREREREGESVTCMGKDTRKLSTIIEHSTGEHLRVQRPQWRVTIMTVSPHEDKSYDKRNLCTCTIMSGILRTNPPSDNRHQEYGYHATKACLVLVKEELRTCSPMAGK